MPAQRVLVVGAGMAGLRTAEALRANGFHGELLVVGDERWMPYNRPPLSKAALTDGTDHAKLAFRVRSNASDVTWRLGAAVTSVDLTARQARTADGGVLGYDALVAATGVRPRRLGVQGPTAGRHVVRTLLDSVALRAELEPGARVVVLGAGFIGCEVAATARQLGCTVDCVALDTNPMLRPLGVELGAELQRRHEAHGVRFHLGVGVSSFTGEERVTGVGLTDGTRLRADVVVEALGSACTTGWLRGNDLDLTDGVRTDTALRPVTVDGSVVDGVAAVGDLARFPNPRFGPDAHRVEHWSTATDTGRRAGAVLAAHLRGAEHEPGWDVLPSFWTDQYDLRLHAYGMPALADPDGIRVRAGELTGECIVGYHRAGNLVGVVALGMLTAVHSYRRRVGAA